MRRETLRDAIALGKIRWAQVHSFDLDDATWERLFTSHRPGNVLQAIRLTKDSRDPRPEKRYARFEAMIAAIEAEQSYTQN